MDGSQEAVQSLLTEVAAAKVAASEAKVAAAEATRVSKETHDMVQTMHRALMMPPEGQDRSLVYQFAKMLEDWKRHKWAFQTVIFLAGAAVSIAGALAVFRGMWWGKP